MQRRPHGQGREISRPPRAGHWLEMPPTLLARADETVEICATSESGRYWPRIAIICWRNRVNQVGQSNGITSTHTIDLPSRRPLARGLRPSIALDVGEQEQASRCAGDPRCYLHDHLVA